jgi:hypothetical protein
MLFVLNCLEIFMPLLYDFLVGLVNDLYYKYA